MAPRGRTRTRSEGKNHENKPEFPLNNSAPEPENVGAGGEQHVESEEERLVKEIANMPLWTYLWAELTRGYLLENEEEKFAERRERVYTFMKIPQVFEKLMFYGFFLCLDAFLFIFTFLPLRVIIALIRLITMPCLQGKRSRLEPAQICDLIKAGIIIVCTNILFYVDTSMLYHLVRGQSIIKLYIIFNMLEVADRLFSAVGQDILDALFWTATEPRGRKRDHFGVIPHFLMAITYVFLHSTLVLFQATCLNVAFNSHNKSLLTVMMSNNFAEVQSNVFKSFGKKALFEMSCNDIRERFHYHVLLYIVVMRNMTEFNWSPDHLYQLIPDVSMIIAAEYLVDWVKHAFITKFNEIPADVYDEYRASLAYDMISSRQKNAFSDHSDLVSRRMGFIPLPLTCLVYMITRRSVKVQGTTGIFLLALTYLALVTVKVLNSIVLLGNACKYVKESDMFKNKLASRPGSRNASRAGSQTSLNNPNPTSPPPNVEITRTGSFSIHPSSKQSNDSSVEVIGTDPVNTNSEEQPAEENSDLERESTSASKDKKAQTSVKTKESVGNVGQHHGKSKDEDKESHSGKSHSPKKESPEKTLEGAKGEDHKDDAQKQAEKKDDKTETKVSAKDTELKYRGSKTDIREVDRFTLCGKEII
ncbi:PREDICTED: transmembrane anterior posterior transformation protein 1 homolog isoform X2 [Branchiostoma belcheri]|uniref:Transmembrane anterior posterior transformation protein 1 homolog isoform X2 n=1 Tax=Branchiostoma belcheri TaxID=7741 RepID=A0A6P4Z9L6_BRABE|nr:PREDICTED: transmembrane anterior posterior transformation protein 1 homolog isoform X2 [Branchiostoma belcheri]